MANGEFHEALSFGGRHRFYDAPVDTDFRHGWIVFGAQLAVAPSAQVDESDGYAVFVRRP